MESSLVQITINIINETRYWVLASYLSFLQHFAIATRLSWYSTLLLQPFSNHTQVNVFLFSHQLTFLGLWIAKNCISLWFHFLVYSFNTIIEPAFFQTKLYVTFNCIHQLRWTSEIHRVQLHCYTHIYICISIYKAYSHYLKVKNKAKTQLNEFLLLLLHHLLSLLYNPMASGYLIKAKPEQNQKHSLLPFSLSPSFSYSYSLYQ